MPCYRAFGQRLALPFACPELPAAEGPADIRVELATIPPGPPPAPDAAVRLRSRLGTCLVQGGSRVTLQRAPGATDAELCQWLLGSAMAALLYQQGLLLLHAAAVELDHGALLFAGPSGTGKSTLAAALVRRGLRLICDDLAALRIEDAAPIRVLPGYPQLKLADDVIEPLSLDRHVLRPLCRGLDKRGLPLADRFCEAPRPLRRVFLLELGDDELGDDELGDDELGGNDRPIVERTGGPASVAALLARTYRPYLCRGPDPGRGLFEGCAEIAACAELWRLARPRARIDVDALATAVLSAAAALSPQATKRAH